MRKIFSVLVATLLFATSAISGSANVITQEQLDNMKPLKDAEGVRVVPVDKNGVVKVPKTISPDSLQHSLVQLEENTAAAVMSSARATSFATLDYRNGVFDVLPPEYLSFVWPTTEALTYVTDNNLTSTVNLLQGQWHTIKLAYPIKITGYYHNTSEGRISVSFYKENVYVGSRGSEATKEGYQTFEEITADRIDLSTNTGKSQYLNEFELFGDISIDYKAISDIEATEIDLTSAKLSFKVPEDMTFYKETEIILNEKSIYKGLDSIIELSDLEINSLQSVVLRAHYKDGNYIDTLYTFKTLPDTTPPADVTELKAVQTGESIKLTYTLPTDKDFSHVNIYRKGSLVKANHKEDSFLDENPVLNSVNEYKVVAVDERDNKSKGQSVSIKHFGTSVSNVKATAADFTTVTLSWNNPAHKDFENVTIYRKSQNQNLLRRIVNFFSADDGYEPLFETNGTIFKDRTVAAETSYSYKLTTTINEVETQGVVVNITTPKTSVVGGESTVNANKDYTFSWTAPTTGKVKVMVGGTLYKTVDAADKKVTIESSAMKYDFSGAPQVTLVPVDESGNEGIATKPPGTSGSGGNIGTEGQVKLPSEVSASNTLMLAVQLLGIVGGFILLGLVFALMPKLIRLIKEAFERRRGVADGK